MSKIMKDVSWNLFSQVIPAITAIFCIPLLVDKAGLEIFGIITLVWALINYAGILDFGVSKVLTKMVAESRNELGKARNIALIGMMLMIVFGIVVAGLIISFKSIIVSGIYNSSINPSELSALVIVVAFASFAVCISNGLRGILEGHEEFAIVAFVRTPMTVWSFVSPLVVLPFSNNLAMLILPLVIARVLVCLIFLYICYVKRYLSVSLPNNFKEISCKLGSYGSFIAISNFVSPLMSTLDRFFVAESLGSSNVAYYSTSQEVILKFLIIPMSLARAIFPRMSRLKDSSQVELDNDLWRGLFYVSLALLGVLITFSWTIFAFWIDVFFAENAYKLFCIMCIGMYANSMASIPFTSLQARGHAKSTAIIHLVELPFFVVGLYILTTNWGMLGAAIAWSTRCFVDAVAMVLFDSLYLQGGQLLLSRILDLILGVIALSFIFYISIL